MKPKLRIGVLFGGRSAEHEISLLSARNIMAGLDREKYEVVPIGIDKNGRWVTAREAALLLDDAGKNLPAISARQATSLEMVPGNAATALQTSDTRTPLAIDVAIPVLHGTYGEDGSVQGLLKLLDIPCVGPGTLGSAVGMDKDVMKRLLRDAGVPIGRFRSYGRHQATALSIKDCEALGAELGWPLYVKPANQGSSVGVSRARDAAELRAALADALQYDTKVLVEENVPGREIECAVLGNDQPQASIPGEIIPKDGFYSYERKYLDEKGAVLELPAKLSPAQVSQVQELAIRTYQALCLEGMTRVDMFLLASGELLVNEVNTIPGFTDVSMYPKLWELSGLPLPRLLDRLIDLARESHAARARLKTSVTE